MGDTREVIMKNLKYTLPLAMALALTMTVPANAGESGNANKYTAILVAATSAEMPAKAAFLVSQADARHLEQTTIAVVKAAVGLNPAAAPTIVGTIAKAEPSMAATAAATAVALVPHMAAAIARAAAVTAPKQAGAIVEAICRVAPATYPNVATAVSEVVPGAAKEIMAGIAAAIPELKDPIHQTMAGYNDANLPSVPVLVYGFSPAPSALVAASPAFTGSSASSSFTPITALPMGPGGGNPGTGYIPPPPTYNPTNGYDETGGNGGVVAP